MTQGGTLQTEHGPLVRVFRNQSVKTIEPEQKMMKEKRSQANM